MLENVYADTVVHEDLISAGFATNRGFTPSKMVRKLGGIDQEWW